MDNNIPLSLKFVDAENRKDVRFQFGRMMGPIHLSSEAARGVRCCHTGNPVYSQE